MWYIKVLHKNSIMETHNAIKIHNVLKHDFSKY
jgi:hypothetical protein